MFALAPAASDRRLKIIERSQINSYTRIRPGASQGEPPATIALSHAGKKSEAAQ
jgi:hypothetical protein